MKKLYFFTLAALLAPAIASANIVYQSFGNGLVFDAGVNMGIDINNDGTTDFYANPLMDEVGFQPIFAVGCYGTTSTSVGVNSYNMQTFLDGETVSYTSTYFEESRPASIAINGGPAAGWIDGEAQYVGFMIFNTSSYGWMKIRSNAATGQLIIEEWAYTNTESEIDAGDRGIASGVAEAKLADLSIYPNPASDNFNIELASASVVNVTVFNNLGQAVYAEKIEASTAVKKHTINTATWTKGQYIIRIENDLSVVKKKLSVLK